MKLKRLLATFLSLTMIVGGIVLPQTTASAYLKSDGRPYSEYEYSDQKADIAFVYLGKTTGPAAAFNGGQIDFDNPQDLSKATFDTGDVIWIGVRLDNLDRIKELLENGSLHDDTTGAIIPSAHEGNKAGGLYAASYVMSYNKDYLTAIDSSDFIFNNTVQKFYPKFTLSDVGVNDKIVYTCDEVTGDTGTVQMATQEACVLPETATSGSHLTSTTQSIQFSDAYEGSLYEPFEPWNVPRMFKPVQSGKQYVATFAFRVNKVPENGLKVLQGRLSASFQWQLNWSKAIVQPISWNANATTPGSTLKSYLNLTNAEGDDTSDGVVDIFPSKYTVKYYKNVDDAKAAYNKTEASDQSVATVTKEADDETLLGDNSTVGSLPDDSLFEVPTGMVISGFKSLDGADNTTPKDFTATTKMIDSNYDLNNTIYVYPETTQGTPVKFDSNYDQKMAQYDQDVEHDDYIYQPPEGNVTVSDGIVKAAEEKAMSGVTGWAIEGWYYDEGCTPEKKVEFDNLNRDENKGEGYTFYAKWTQNYTIRFWKNNGTTETEAYKTVLLKPGETIKSEDIPAALTSADYEGYTFTGKWNTAPNGASTGKEYLQENLGTAEFNGDTDLYAQWEPIGTNDEEDGDNDDDDEPWVTVKFHKNHLDSSDVEGEYVDPDPDTVLITLDDIIGDNRKPNEPKRKYYKFKGWYTTPDAKKSDGSGGAGTEINMASTAITAETPDIIPNGDGTYELNLYAQWEIDDNQVTNDNDKLTVTFYKNLKGTGTADTDVYASYPVVRNTALGFVPTYIATNTEDQYANNIAWSTTGRIRGKYAGTEFDPTAKITGDDDTKYYAVWSINLVAGVYGEEADNKINTTVNDLKYKGEEHDLTYVIYRATQSSNEDGSDAAIVGEALISDADETALNAAGYILNYYKTSEVKSAEPEAVDLVHVLAGNDTYTPVITIDDDTNQFKGYEVLIVDKSKVTINPVILTPLVDTAKQSVKLEDTVENPVVAFKGLQGDDITDDGDEESATSTTAYDIKFYKYVDTETEGNTPGVVDADELTELTNGISDIENDKEGKYVVKVFLSEANANDYTLQPAEATVEGKTVGTYTGAGVEGVAKNIRLVVNKGSIWITDLVVESKTADVYEDKNGDKKHDKNDRTVENGKILEGATEPEGKDAGDFVINVGKDDNKDSDTGKREVEFDLQFPEGTNPSEVEERVHVVGPDGEPLDDDKWDIVPDPDNDGHWKLVVEVESEDPTKPDQFTIVVDDDEGEPQFEYDFTVKTLKDTPYIEFEPGNSPYGLIERMRKATSPWSDEDVLAARAAFIDESGSEDGKPHGTYQYGAKYVPDHAQTTFNYSLMAWGFEVNPNDDSKNDWAKFNDPKNNMDLNPDALFVYESDIFKDPGFTLYDQEGNEVKMYDEDGNEIKNPDITKTLTVTKITGTTDGVGLEYILPYQSNVKTDTQTINEADDGTISLFQLLIPPGVYYMEYKYSYTDKLTGNAVTSKLIDKRPVVVTSLRGDLELTFDPAIQYSDFTKYKNAWSKLAGNKDAAFFVFRAGDLEQESNLDMAIQYSDATVLKNTWSKLGNPDAIQYYNSSLLK